MKCQVELGLWANALSLVKYLSLSIKGTYLIWSILYASYNIQGIATIEETLADYRETVNSLAMNEQIVKLRQKIEIEQKLKQR